MRGKPGSHENPGRRRKGRGALGNPANRFDPREVEPFDDGWGSLEQELPPLETIVTPETSRTIITRNDSPDIPFYQSINPYKGCEHGCVYCFARPTHAYLGLSPGLDFETRIFSKPAAAELLEKELSGKGYRCRVIALGANTDPYQPAERKLGISRRLLEVFAAFNHPVAIVTKSNLVLRDLDLLAPMAARRLACVMISVTTLDPELARGMEPRAPAPRKRIDAIRTLSDAGVPAGVLASPMIPALNDSELERILEAAASAGARWAGYVLLRLPHEVKRIFTEWLEASHPLKAARVLMLVRESHGGELYDSAFGSRMRGSGPYAQMLLRRFETACRRLGLQTGQPPLDASLFRVPDRLTGSGAGRVPGGQLPLLR
ncbi:MAG: radical SAM protein [Acidobacteria bacterium]|nr:MAG: radical SAM protein [Acidobacteriota bacterium]